MEIFCSCRDLWMCDRCSTASIASIVGAGGYYVGGKSWYMQTLGASRMATGTCGLVMVG